jgi:hypothetical protein
MVRIQARASRLQSNPSPSPEVVFGQMTLLSHSGIDHLQNQLFLGRAFFASGFLFLNPA